MTSPQRPSEQPERGLTNQSDLVENASERAPRRRARTFGRAHPAVRALATIAVMSAVAWFGIAALNDGGALWGTTPPSDATPTPLALPSLTVEPFLPNVRPIGAENVHGVAAGRHTLTVSGVTFSFDVPPQPPAQAESWARYGNVYMSKSVMGPQGAEAMIHWARFDADSPYSEPCGEWWGSPPTLEVKRLAERVARYALADATPTRVTLDGWPAAFIEFGVIQEPFCSPGLLDTWEGPLGGPFWDYPKIDDKVRIWIVQVKRAVMVIEADTHSDAGAELEHEVQQIVESIRFG